MAEGQHRSASWRRLPVILKAVIVGTVVGLVAANVWPLLLVKLGMPIAAAAEAVFLTTYVWWASGGGPPHSLQAGRKDSFRTRKLSRAEWYWGLAAALFFALTAHAAFILLFRLVQFPAAAFHAGYDISFISSAPLRWLAIFVSALSAGICEETGFRGYMQRPMEKRHGVVVAISISSLLFALVHLNKDWSLIGVVPIIFGWGVLLGMLAWASRSLVFCMIGHTLMDIGMFAYWWTQIAGRFSERPISETGLDLPFYLEWGALAAVLAITLIAIARLRRLSVLAMAS